MGGAMSIRKFMSARNWVLMSVAAALVSCGGDSSQQNGPCVTGDGRGEGSNVIITNAGSNPQELGHTICVGGGPSGFDTPIDSGTLGTLWVDTTLYTIGATGVCGDNVDVNLDDTPPDASDYQPNASWGAGLNATSKGSCTLTAQRAGTRLSGHFQGHLTRHKSIDHAPDEFMDIELDYWIQVPAGSD
jgi:hypothetical protein